MNLQRLALIAVFILCCLSDTHSQANCSTAATLLPGCATTADLQNAATASPTGACGGATSTTTYSVWYKFTAGAASQSITLAGLGSGTGASLSATTTYIEAFSGSCGALSSIATCQNASSALNLTGLTIGTSYFVRIYVTSDPTTNPAKRTFTITLSGPPSNDLCTNAYPLVAGTTCTNVSGTLANATSSSPTVASTCSGNPGGDVWYTFIAPSTYPTITLSNTGSNLSSPYIQLLSGSCGSFTTVTCANGTTLTPSSALTVGNTYYIRVYSSTASPTGCNWNFDICVSYPAPPSNDDCTGATALTSGTTNSAGTVWGATATSGIPTGCATGTPDDDVWYKITTSTFSNSLSVSLSSVGSDLTTSGPRIQVLSGSCGSLTSVTCGTTSVTTSVGGNATYYIRVYSAGSGSIGTNSANATFSITATVSGLTVVTSGRMNEVFQQTNLSTSNVLNYPWEVTYGPDNNLWITESRGYKVYKMDPSTGTKTTVLDISYNSTSSELTTAEHTAFNVQFSNSGNVAGCSCWPQGGLAGLAIHPQFTSGKPYVYISYVRKFDSVSSKTNGGVYFRNSLVRFTYNSSTGKLESPVALCDTLPGSSDHNSQRVIIAPVGVNYYVFYAQGDMGAGQFGNQFRTNNAQSTNSYEGKILRFNLEADGDAGSYDQWIPSDNPYNGTRQSAIWSIGIRNNQGFAYDTTTQILYGASHGPYSDDEINAIEGAKNYGHPLIEGFAADGNCNNTTAGTAPNMAAGGSSCPTITNEVTAAAAIGSSYKDPLFSAYPNSTAFPSISNLWNTTNGSNGNWPTEAWSGLDLYPSTLIPGWKRSLIAASLKWGRLVRLKLDATGNATAPTNTVSDTVTYFNSQNRFRDLAFSPSGKDIFVIMDNSSTTSGPGSGNPTVPTCAGCLQKYTFLGYMPDANGKSTISTSIDVAAGTANACQSGTTITIDNTNANIWVPITGQDGNILAEIKANGNLLGTVTSSFYTNTGAVRENSQKKLYSNRNITITPQNQPTSSVNVRIYMTAAEFNSLKAATNSQGVSSGVNTISDVSILKNSDVCSSAMSNSTLTITPQYAEAFGSNYVLQGTISSFSTFYLGNPAAVILPVQLLTFDGSLQNNNSTFLQWETTNEVNTSHFTIERSADGNNFTGIGNVTAIGSNNSKTSYSFTDNDAGIQNSPILYYRLKIVDINGQYAYSRIISVVLNKNINVFIFPNPVKQILNIKLSGRETNPVLLQITDLTGRVVYSEKRNGSNTNLNVDVKQWRPQVYILKVINSKNEVLTTQKFEKM